LLNRLGVTPNMVTLIGLLLTAGVAAVLANGSLFVGGWLLIAAAIFDLFDGALARATGKASPLGAFMDSTFDRWGEGIVYVGIVWGGLNSGFERPVILAAAAMASAFMVSYTRAKSESLGFAPGTGMANVGLAPREVRIVILTIGLVAAGLLPGLPTDTSGSGGGAYPTNVIALELALGLIAVLATITTIQRIVVTMNQARHEHPG
jgi:CDP-diacylglycerol--glycerol-3-phosphate 3-phosphatidyltransferase